MQGSGKHWVGSWAAAPAPAEGVVGFNNHTLRMCPRISLGGGSFRVRISNAYGNRPLPIGASLTDGNISTIDAFCRWPDQLARRLVERGGRPIGVMNNGLGGNRILHDLRGDSGVRRFDRDVLAQPGVSHAIVMLGTNGLRNRWAKPEEEVTGEQMIAGLQQMAVRAHRAR